MTLWDAMIAMYEKYGYYKDAVKAADKKEIEDLYEPLATKYSVDALTKADAAAVAKLQAAIDAYIAEYNESPDENGSIEKTTAKMADVIAALNQKAVESLKITARSTAKKGSITVKWTVKGEADIDGYQIWKSTKANKGYKKAFTTTKKTYKNSKGLKKGTRYYYKVRAYKVIDGKNVYSDWSNKANRKAK